MGATSCGNWGRYSITSNFYGTNEKLSAKIIEDAVEMSEKWISLDYMLNRLSEKDRNLQQVKRLVAVKM